jgi:hypothetical protein
MPIPGRLRKCRKAHIAWWNVRTEIAAATKPNIARIPLSRILRSPTSLPLAALSIPGDAVG